MEMAWKKQEASLLASSLRQSLHCVSNLNSEPENPYRGRLIQSKLIFLCCGVLKLTLNNKFRNVCVMLNTHLSNHWYFYSKIT